MLQWEFNMADITLLFPRSEFLIEEDVFPPLGILYLGTFLKKLGFDVQCLDMGLGHTINDISSDIVGVSFTSPQKQAAFEVSQKLQHKHLIAGGVHPTHCPDECLAEGFDTVIRGYGEDSIYDFLVNHSLNTPWKEVYEPCESLRAFDELPIPDRTLLPITAYKYKINGLHSTVLMTSRGCPYTCSFCAKINQKYDYRSAELVIEEIEYLNYEFGYQAFMIFDDIFIVPKERFDKLVQHLKTKNFTFRCFVRSNLINEDVCRGLRAMGVYEVGIGIESGSQKILSQNMKRTTVEMNTNAVQLLKKYGIRVKTFLIAGLPGESKETIAETREWVRVNKPDDFDITIFQPLPGSDIVNNPSKYDISFIKSDKLWYKGKRGEYTTTVNTSFLTSEEIIKYRDDLESEFKSSLN